MARNASPSQTRIEVLATDETASIPDSVPLRLDHELKFSIDALNSYAVADFDPLVFDAMVLAGGIEFADRFRKRSSETWARNLAVSIPVHDLARWEKPDVRSRFHASRASNDTLSGTLRRASFRNAVRSAVSPNTART